MWGELFIGASLLFVGWLVGHAGSEAKAHLAYLRGAQVGLDMVSTAAASGFDRGYALGLRHGRAQKATHVG